jgi:hypothetical protein
MHWNCVLYPVAGKQAAPWMETMERRELQTSALTLSKAKKTKLMEKQPWISILKPRTKRKVSHTPHPNALSWSFGVFTRKARSCREEEKRRWPAMVKIDTMQ